MLVPGGQRGRGRPLQALVLIIQLLLLLEGLNLHWASIRAVWMGPLSARRVEKALLAAHFIGYLTAVFVVLVDRWVLVRTPQPGHRPARDLAVLWPVAAQVAFPAEHAAARRDRL